ncbi:MAG: AAA family ATPase, partial [Patescibacteria group bacterium]
MFIKELTLTNFRNHKKATFNFSKGVNLILGPNTSGKSNVLEVLYFLATGSFIKASLDGDIIAYNESFCRI